MALSDCCYSFLEEELARRYRDAAPSTLALLQGRCESVTQELLAIENQLKSVQDAASLRKEGKPLLFGRLPLTGHRLASWSGL